MRYFKRHEFADYDKMDEDFLKWLDLLRHEYGAPIHINSSYRDPNHNEAVGGVKASAHTEIPCRAVDIRCKSSKERFKIVSLALDLGCNRIGVGETFVHLDFATDRVDEVMWTYYK